MKHRNYLTVALMILSLTAGAQYLNVQISDVSVPEEPSIMINPLNTDQIVAGANLDSYYYSADGGATWQRGELSSEYGVWGDPCIVVDTNGYFYFFHLANPPSGSWIDRIVCQKSINGGHSWSNGTYMGLNGGKVQDKEWACVDRATNNIYVIWTQFDEYGSSNPLDSTIIRFSRSTNGGLTWSEAVRINQIAGNCLDDDNTVEGAVPAIGPNGEVLTSWAGPAGLIFTKSTDGGLTWPATNIFVSDIPGGWDLAIPGISRANGMPVTCCDLSGGPYHGSIYINWSDQRNGLTDTDIWFSKSTDGGNTWSSPLRVNDDPPGKHQFFTWMTVDQTSGLIYIVFYDRRSYSNNLTDVYLAISEDGGETFSNIKISETPFYPTQNIFFGDYTNISAHNGIVRPVWARLDTDQLSVWTALVDSIHTGIIPDRRLAEPFSLEQNYPNPAEYCTHFPYKIHTPSRVSLKVYDLYGREIITLLNDEFHVPGRYVERLDISAESLPAGFYYFSLISGDQSIRKKMIIK